MDQFQDDDDEQDGEKKSRFKNSKKTGDVNKFKRDKNAPSTKTDDKQVKEEKVFKAVGKVTLGSKWETDEDVDKKIAAEKLKLLDAQAQNEEVKPVKKEPKFVGKANIGEKAKQFEEAEQERQRLAQEKLKQMEKDLPKATTKIELVKDEPKASKFTNSKKDVDNKFKKPKVDNEDALKTSSTMSKDDDKSKKSNAQVVKAPVAPANIGTTLANKW